MTGREIEMVLTGREIQAIRTSLRLSQAEFAVKLGVETIAVYLWEDTYPRDTVVSKEIKDKIKALDEAGPHFYPHACCEKATVLPCVCAYSYECPEHGTRHIGSHE